MKKKRQATLVAALASLTLTTIPVSAQTLVSGQAGFGKQWTRSRQFTIQGLSHSPSTWDWAEYFGVGMTMLNRDSGYNHPINPLNRPPQYASSPWQSFLPVPVGNPQAGITEYNNLRLTPYNAGWFVGDEPTTIRMADHGTVAAYIRQTDPSKPVFTNGTHIEWGAASWYGNTSQPGYTYENYWNDLNAAMNPDILCYDFYSFNVDDFTQPRYLENVMFVRNKGKQWNKPYWAWMQTWGGGNARRPSESDLRFNVYTHLTAGYTGICYWTYDHDPGGTGDGLVDINGNQTPQYAYAAQTNAETLRLGEALKMLESTDVRFVPGRQIVSGSITAPNSTPSGLTNWTTGAGGDSGITNVSVGAGQLGSEKNGMIGHFTDDAGERYFMLTNLNHGQYLSASAAALSFTLQFAPSINTILRLNRATGQQELIYLNNHAFTWSLPGGTGDLFKYSTSPFFTNGPGWGVNASGDWNIGANWGSGAIPNAADATANFGTIITGARTVYTDLPVKTGTLTFNNPNTYTLAGNGSLTIDVSTGTGAVNVLQGSHRVNLPLIFADDSTVTIASGATLTLGNPTTIKAGKTVTKTGNLQIKAPLILESGAALVLGPGGATLAGMPAFAAGSQIDVRDGRLTIEFSGQSTLTETVRAALADAYANGDWSGEGISTTTATSAIGLGWVEASAGVDIQRTFYGDANLDGTVDSTDFAALVGGYGSVRGGVWAQGDFDYDGRIDTRDFNHLAGNFGNVLPVAELGTLVPEPGVVTAFLAIGFGLASGRRTRNSG